MGNDVLDSSTGKKVGSSTGSAVGLRVGSGFGTDTLGLRSGTAFASGEERAPGLNMANASDCRVASALGLHVVSSPGFRAVMLADWNTVDVNSLGLRWGRGRDWCRNGVGVPIDSSERVLISTGAWARGLVPILLWNADVAARGAAAGSGCN